MSGTPARTYQGDPAPPVDPAGFQRLLTSVAKAVLAQGGPKALAEWQREMEQLWSAGAKKG